MTQAGDVFANRYVIERHIARGGMADVYLARDEVLDRRVAVKVLFAEFARDPSFVERFRREAQSAAALNHASIVGIYDWGQEHGTYFIVMEYVDGQSLRDIIRAQGPLGATQAAAISAEIADALAFAHRHGVVHRDIKPGNVLITTNGQVKVADFGIAANPADPAQGLTQTGAVMGTATYFSPEQAQGFTVDGRSDVYSLGVVLYEMVTGAAPFAADTPVAVAMKHVHEAPVRPSIKVADVPPEFERIIAGAMAKNADRRYQTADELRDDLVRFERGREPVGSLAGNGNNDVTVAAAPLMPAPTLAHDDRSGRRMGGTIVTIVGLGLLAGLLAVMLVPSLREQVFGKDKAEVPTFEVPDVATGNPTYEEAAARIRGVEGANFKVERIDAENSDVEVDHVFRQNPEAGRLLAKGRTVRLYVSSTEVTVPDLVGKQFDEAAEILRNRGLVAERIDVDAPADKAPGEVLSQDPAARAKVDRGTTVKLTVVKEPLVPVPSVVGQSQAAASATLRDAGFVVELVPAPSNTVPAGQAIGTNPAVNTPLPKGSTVRLYVSTGPDTVPVPNVVGYQRDDAISTLQAQGFGVTANCGTPTATVSSQNPTGGTQVQHGSNVTINCSS